MRLVFLGTPDFAARCLEKLLSSRHTVAAVVTAPDKPKGRGRKIEPSDVKALALKHQLRILQPDKLKDLSFLAELRACQAELFVVVAFRILPEDVFMMPPAGCINLHASLLPQYRGAAPINWAIINGERETGLTTFFIQKRVDTGNVILQEKIPIGSDETFEEMHDKMAEIGAALLLKTIDLIEAGQAQPLLQDSSLATPAPKLSPEMGRIDWDKSAVQIHNLVRGLSSRPGAYTFRDGKRITILRTRPQDRVVNTRPGTIIQADSKEGIVVACGAGALELLKVKPESGKAMSGEEYIRGYKLRVGEEFEETIGSC